MSATEVGLLLVVVFASFFANDLLAVMYQGSDIDKGGIERFDRYIFLLMGHGEKCDESLDGAPTGQLGTADLADGRTATWAIGTSDRGWLNRKAAWVAWPGRHGDTTVRIVSQDFGIETLKSLATNVAKAEA